MSDMMTFPATVEEFMEQYKIVDTEKIYTNGADLVPIFRMMQWFEHVSATDALSRQAAIDALDVLCQEHRYKIPGKRETYSQYNEAWQDALDRAEGAIFNLPPAQPERKKGAQDG